MGSCYATEISPYAYTLNKYVDLMCVLLLVVFLFFPWIYYYAGLKARVTANRTSREEGGRSLTMTVEHYIALRIPVIYIYTPFERRYIRFAKFKPCKPTPRGSNMVLRHLQSVYMRPLPGG